MKTLLSLVLLAMSATLAFGQAPGSFNVGYGCILTWCGSGRIALAGDSDGSGRAHFLNINPKDHVIDFARMSSSGKLFTATRAREGFARTPIAGICGRFTGGKGADVAALCEDGSLMVFFDMKQGANIYSGALTALTFPPALLPKAPVKLATGDFDGDGKSDILAVGADGKALLLHNDTTETNYPRFSALPLERARILCHRISAGEIGESGKAKVVWLDSRGSLYAAEVSMQSGSASLGSPEKLLTASQNDGLAVGHFRGEKRADIIVGRRLLPGGDASRAIPLPDLPDAAKAKGDTEWIAADFNGDGKDDLLRVQHNGDPLDGDHVYIHYAHDSSDKPELRFDDSDNDGLPDAWETGAVKPGGLDLKALGCTPDHADVIVEIQRMENAPEAQLRADLEKAARYFAALPVKNPDGKPGIALHFIYLPPIPLSEGSRPWWELGVKYHIAAHRGVTHWMMFYNGGGGQSNEMADDGSSGRFGMPAVFIHEFGHQLGLDHTGRWNAGWCPTYPSLMNYAYSYQLNGKSENVGFSDGRLSKVTLNERHLDEYLPLPMDKISFLSGPPYRYRMKPAPDGKGTLIDWNWNGVFGEKNITADINYGYSTTGGERHIVGKSYTAPCVAAYGKGRAQRLLLFYGALPIGAKPPPVDIKAQNASLSPTLPGRLCMRGWQGENAQTEGNKWSDETQVAASDVTGEASACFFQNAMWVVYPTLSGLQINRVTLDAKGVPQIGAAQLIPDSRGAQPTLTPLAGRLALLLWRDAKTPLGFRWLTVNHAQLAPDSEVALEFTSTTPVGCAEGLDRDSQTALWVGLTQNQDAGRPNRWQIRCLIVEEDGALREEERFWTDGDKGGNRGEGRVTLLWEADRAFGAEGRWYFLQRGAPHEDLNQMHIAMKIADKSVNGGSLTRRYYDEWTNSRCAPGVCWFHGDIVLAIRWFGDSPAYKDNNTLIGFFGRGIETAPMGDFDDLFEIRTYGLTRSIPSVTE